MCALALPAMTRRARMLLPPGDVEDLVQETFLAAVSGLDSWRQDASFCTWLNGILRHKVADFYRGRRVDEVSLDVVESHLLTSDYRTDAAVRLTLAHLPVVDQEIMQLRFYEGLPFAGVAQSLDISLEAAKSRFRRAKARFAREWCA